MKILKFRMGEHLGFSFIQFTRQAKCALLKPAWETVIYQFLAKRSIKTNITKKRGDNNKPKKQTYSLPSLRILMKKLEKGEAIQITNWYNLCVAK